MKKREASANDKALQKANSTNEVQRAGRAELMATINEELCQVTGVKAAEVANQIVSQMRAMQIWGADGPENDQLFTAFAMMAELKPANATEALLAVQMFGVHEAALLFLKRATLDGQSTEGSDANVVRATRLMRLFNEQLEAMTKLKGKNGQQKVTVEHVHVHSGGQAVVGVLDAPRGKERG
jgi:hypothetical protein